MAKRRAAFLLKQQRKAQEARLRKQQQEVESEVKRDETRYAAVSHTHKCILRIRNSLKVIAINFYVI